MPATTAAADSSTVITGRRMNASERFMARGPSSRLLGPGLAALAAVFPRLFRGLGARALRLGHHAAGPQVLRALDHDALAVVEAVDHREALLEVGEPHVLLRHRVVGA